MTLERHTWFEAVLLDRGDITFWVCLRCGRVSPGPTDNEDLRPSDVGPCGGSGGTPAGQLSTVPEILSPPKPPISPISVDNRPVEGADDPEAVE